MTGLVVGEVFANAARAVPDRTAIVLGGHSLTFAEIDAGAELALRRLLALGVTAGDRVACTPGAGIGAVPVFAALARLGAVAVAGDEDAVDAYKPVLVVADAAAAAELIADLDDEDPEDLPEPPDVEPAETDPCLIAPSGRHGVLLSHRALVLRSHPGAPTESGGAHVLAGPLDGAAAWTTALGRWHARDTLILVPDADPTAIRTAVRAHGATRLTAGPKVWRALSAQPEDPRPENPPDTDATTETTGIPEATGRTTIDTDPLDTLRFADTAPTEIAVLEGIARVAPDAAIRIVHGSAETGVLATLTGPDVFAHPGACGVPGVLQYVALNPDGEMCVRGPLLFDGYVDDAAATADVLTDGWYRTGDLAVLDEDDGVLTVTGRTADLIRIDGENVGPGEVERVLGTHPGVRDVAVIGLPHPEHTRVLVAVVVAADPDRVPGPTALRLTCEDAGLANHKHPRRVFYATELPTGANRREDLVREIGGER